MRRERKCWPVEVWPEADQAAWRLATEPASLFGEGGTASHWKPKTKNTVAKANGRWLRFLHDRNWLDDDDPAGRVTQERVKTYWEQLRDEVAPVTAAGRIVDLGEAARVMAPERDWAWLKTAAQKLVSRAKPSRDKGKTTLPARDLFQLGITLMERAENDPDKRTVRCGARYRMGLMIVLLTATGLRRANFAELELDSSFMKAGNRFRVRLYGQVTKGHRPHELLLPAELSPLIDRYLGHWRPVMLNKRDSDALWVTWLGDDLTEGGFYSELRKVTERELNVAIHPHAFRDCIATSVALEDPAHVRMLKPILQHRSLSTTNQHYIRASQAAAVRKHQDSVLKIRQAAAKSSKRRRVA